MCVFEEHTQKNKVTTSLEGGWGQEHFKDLSFFVTYTVF